MELPSDEVAVAIAHIRQTDPTEDEFIQAYLRGAEDAMRLILEAEQRRYTNAAASGGYAS
jgi:hypothetical protein